MLTFQLTGAILGVKESIIGWHSTKVTWWYYDTKKWLRTLHGRQGEVPSQPMNAAQIEWVQKYYLPKVTNI